MTTAGLALALSVVAPVGAHAAISGPVRCNSISAPANADFFGARNCYSFSLVMTIQYRAGGVAHHCVRSGSVLWTDQSAHRIELGMVWTSRLQPYGSVVRC
ncbi:MAG: hypothetical protein RL499_1630 [Actinomycetota bacterium]|jgi:hypothetical protein